MQRRFISLSLVFVQFAVLFYLATSGPWLARGWPLGLEIAGGLLGLWAIASMSASRLNITPDVRDGAHMVAHGPYRWIRHPMYTSLLLAGTALVWSHPSPLRWAALVVLGVDLLVKLHYEEGLLVAAFPGYPEYQARTKRLLPYLY